jgi:hypothetical protein
MRAGSSCDAGDALTELPYFRFAVGSFDTWLQLRDALEDLRLRGMALDSFNCLALQRVFAGKRIIAPSLEAVAIQELSFPENRELICCTAGPLADCLSDRLGSGARSLKDALSSWLVSRHAAHFQETVQAGKILLWLRVTDADDERRAYQSLLTNSSNSVGVHDLAAPGTASKIG